MQILSWNINGLKAYCEHEAGNYGEALGGAVCGEGHRREEAQRPTITADSHSKICLIALN